MPTVLYRLGRFSFRHRRRVLALWLAVVAVVVACMVAFGGSGKLDNTFTVPGSESQQALDRMRTDFPASSGTSAQIVFTARAGHRVTEPAESAQIDAALKAAASAPQVAKVVSPFTTQTVSADGGTAIAQVQYEVPQSGLDAGTVDVLKSAVAVADHDGMRVQVGGQAFGNAPSKSGGADLLGVGVALVILALTFGSLLTAGVLMVSALVGVATAVCGVLSLAGAVSISSTAQSLALMIGLAVGIDYSLFIVTRHRSQLARGMDAEKSAALAVGTAGSAVVFAGATVVIAMAGLTVVGIPYLTAMGLCAAGAVLIAVLVAITLLPAVLGLAGKRMAPKPGSRAVRRERTVAEGGRQGRAANGAERWFRLVTRRPVLTVLAVVALLGALAWPAHGMRLALPDNGTAPVSSSQRLAYDEISEEFGPGFNGPLLVLADTGGSADQQQAAQQIATALRALPDVAAVGKPALNPAAHSALIQVVPASGPSDQATKDLVNTIRSDRAEITQHTGAEIQVTGSTAVSIDVAAKLNAALVPFAAVVVGLSLLLLLLVFRSFVVPVKAAAGFLLSIAATLGVVVSVFQNGHFGRPDAQADRPGARGRRAARRVRRPDDVRARRSGARPPWGLVAASPAGAPAAEPRHRG